MRLRPIGIIKTRRVQADNVHRVEPGIGAMRSVLPAAGTPAGVNVAMGDASVHFISIRSTWPRSRHWAAAPRET